ncbi:MAG TPA: acyl-CoA dehydrogenase [Rhodospirillaceae bacterium]|nr:acyl-CoA dehydrogenase [Rhodospirillaceae bacterium]
MDFGLTQEQEAIKESVSKLCTNFGDDYWLFHDNSGDFPMEFYRAMADAGWLGIAMPEEFGGAGLGVTEAALMMNEVAYAGAMSAASAIHINIFGPHAMVVHGTDEQKARWLPGLIKGEWISCFGVTEPDVGLDTTRIVTRAEPDGNGYVIHGRKIWTSTAQDASKILLIARTTPIEKCDRPIDGVSLFYTDLDRDFCEVREIPKMGRKAVDSNTVFIDGLKVPAEDRIGEEGKGFRYLLDSLNPERVLIASEGIGIGRSAIDRAARYAGERIVFGRPIGQNQAIQHPLAESWCELEAAWLTTLQAAWRYDSKLDCGAQANSAKYLAGEAGFRACERAVMSHGGMGYAKEYHVERLLREILICRIAPVTPHLILSHIAERVLGLPKSY